MTPFTTLTGIAAPLPMANVDTDKIIPARFLKTIERKGLGKAAFASLQKRLFGTWDRALHAAGLDGYPVGEL